MKKRKQQAMIAAGIGIALNLLLGATKLFLGIISKSVSVTGDAVNNLSDSVASIVTITAFALAHRKADREHPLGHGRYEYVAGLVIGILILFAGFQFILTGVQRIISPLDLISSPTLMIILAASVVAKAALAVFYRATNKSVKSDTLTAAALDSVFDALTTGAVLLSIVLQKALPFKLDGYMTVAVALVIVWGGTKTIREATANLLGKGASEELKTSVYQTVTACEEICGAHDLIIHDYGASKRVGTIHAEFERDLTISKAHAIVDYLERSIKQKYGVELAIHVDHIDRSDPMLNSLREQITQALSWTIATIHDLHIEGKTIAFDIVIPLESDKLKEQISTHIRARLSEDFKDYTLEINYDFI